MIALDIILAECFFEILKHWDGNKLSGSVGAAIVTPGKPPIVAVSYKRDGVWCHAERHAIEQYQNRYGDIPKDAVIVTTLSPCFAKMCDRDGMSCTDLIDSLGISRVYTAIMDTNQYRHGSEHDMSFDIQVSNNQTARDIGKMLRGFIEKIDTKTKAFKE